MTDHRIEGTVCISTVNGHADVDMVRHGQVRVLDREGNNRADEAADFRRRRVDPGITDARRNLIVPATPSCLPARHTPHDHNDSLLKTK